MLNSENNKLGKNVIWSVLNQTAGQLMVLAVFLVTARFISKEDFGTMALAMLMVEVMRQLTVESIGLSLLARPKPEKADYNAGFILVVLSSLISAIFLFASSHYLAQIMDNVKLEFALHWICLVILTFGLSKIHETWLIRHMQFKQLALRSMFSIFIGGGVGIYMAVHGFGLISLITQQILTALLGTLFLWMITKWRPSLETGKEQIISLLKFSRHISMMNTINLVSSQSDVFLSSYYLGAAQTGVYNAAKRLSLAAHLIVNGSISQVSMSALSNVNQDIESLRETYLNFCKYIPVFTFPAYIGLAALAAPLVNLLMGDQWGGVAPVLSILAFIATFITIGQLSPQIFMNLNKPYLATRFAILNAISNVLLLALTAKYGLEIMAWALAVKTVVILPIILHVTHSMIGVTAKEYIKIIFPPVISSFLMGGAIYAILQFMTMYSEIIQITVLIPAGSAIYFFSLWVFDKNTVKNLMVFVKTIRK